MNFILGIDSEEIQHDFKYINSSENVVMMTCVGVLINR
jgi:hypothetical protein